MYLKIFLFGLFCSFSTFAQERPLLVRSTSSSNTSVTTTCEIFPDKMVITRAFGDLAAPSFSTKEERKFSISPGISSVIEAAKAEQPRVSRNNLCRGSREYIAAWSKQAGGSDERVIIQFVGACHEDEIVRDGSAANQLRMAVRYACSASL